MNENKCKCSLAVSLTVDGCRYCQPQEYIDRLSEWLDESRNELEKVIAERDELKLENEKLKQQNEKFLFYCDENGNRFSAKTGVIVGGLCTYIAQEQDNE